MRFFADMDDETKVMAIILFFGMGVPGLAVCLHGIAAIIHAIQS